MNPKAMLSGLTGQVAKPWFPLVILVLSTLNVFIVFLSGGVTALFVSTCAARGRKGFMVAAVCNALGALLGYWIFGTIVDRNGTDWVKAQYPDIFASDNWRRVQEAMSAWGWIGAVAISAAPAPLHPLVVFGALSGVGRWVMLSAVFLGRLIKYAGFGFVATAAPGTFRWAAKGKGKKK